MKISANLIRKGNILEHNGRQLVVLDAQMVRPGKGDAFIQVDTRDIRSGTKTQERWRTADTVEKLDMQKVECTFLYLDRNALIFMDLESFEPLTVPRALVGAPGAFLQEGMLCTVDIIEGSPVSVTLPDKVVARVVETDPFLKGPSVISSFKPGVLENGVRILVPPFIEAGTKIVVNTADATYVERAED
jgi:elongation factor P